MPPDSLKKTMEKSLKPSIKQYSGPFLKNIPVSLSLILLTGLVLHLCLFSFFKGQPLTIVDETHYQAIAENLITYQEFSVKTGHPTSMRPPLYPAFLSLVYLVINNININAVRIIQILLCLGIVIMTYLLGKKMFDSATGRTAALICTIYPSFLFFTQFVLSEILFTLLFMMFLYNFILGLTDDTAAGTRTFFLCGLLLGLGALTRTILYPFLPAALIFIGCMHRHSLTRKFKWMLVFALGYALVITPWAIRNTLLHKQMVLIDTMGGFNLYMGNYEHTPRNRAWAAVDLTGDKTWYHGHEETLRPMNEAQKQSWAAERAKEFIMANKWLTIKRSLIKAANFWGVERTVTGGIINGQWPAWNTPGALILTTLIIIGVYTAVMLSAVFGLCFTFQPRRLDIILIVFLVLFFTGLHAIVFGHARYHLPLIPALAVFSAWGIRHWRGLICGPKKNWRFTLFAASSLLLCGIWAREVLFIDGARFLGRLF